MLPSHHKSRGQSKTNGVYLCAVISLAICLLVTFRYWKREVSEFVVVNQRLSDQQGQLSNELAVLGEKANQAQARVTELEEEVRKREEAVSEVSNQLEKEGAKTTELQKQVDAAATAYSVLEQSKSDVDSQLERCENESNEKSADDSKEIRDLKDKLAEETAKILVMSNELTEKQTALDEAQDKVEKLKADVAKKDAAAKKEAAARKQSGEQSGQDQQQGTEIQGAGEAVSTGTLTADSRKTAAVDEQKPLSQDQAFAVIDAQTRSSHVASAADQLQLSAPDIREALPRDGREGEVMFVKGGVEATTGFKEQTADEVLPNPRSGVQDAVPDVTLNTVVATESVGTQSQTQAQ